MFSFLNTTHNVIFVLAIYLFSFYNIIILFIRRIRMKKLLSVLTIFVLVILSSSFAEAHSGRTDSNGGHKCSDKSIAKGLCTGYHYHNGGSSTSSGSNNNYSPVTSPKPTYTPQPTLTMVDVYINNSLKNYNPSAYMKKGTTLVPMRAIFEDLGATVEFDKNTKKITAYKDSKTISLTVGNKTAYVTENGAGNSISLSQPAESYKNTTMVPLRFIAESLGAITEWDSVFEEVKITTTK